MNKTPSPVVTPIRPEVEVTVTDEQHLRAQVDTIMQAEEMTQSELARQVGIASSTLSQWMSGKYGARTDKLVAAVQKWVADYLQRKQRGDMPTAPDFIMTPTAKRISGALDYARSAGDIVLVYGGPGVGKTSTIIHYQRTHPNVWHLQISPATSSVMSLLEEIASAVGIVGYVRNRAALQREIVKRMAGTRGLLVIDEAQHLGVVALEQLRYFTDSLDIGMVLCGNVFVASQFTAGSKGAYLDRLSSRVGMRVHIKSSLQPDIDAIIDAWGFTDEKCRAHARDIGKKPGALRSLNKCFSLATNYANARGKAMCCSDLNRAAKELGLFE